MNRSPLSSLTASAHSEPNKVGLFGLSLFFFVSVARFNDNIPGLATLPLGKLALLIMFLGLFFEPKVRTALHHSKYAVAGASTHLSTEPPSIHKLMGWLFFFVILSVLLSSGHGLSLRYLVFDFSTSIAIYYFTVKYCTSIKAIEKMLWYIAIACAVNSLVVIHNTLLGNRAGISPAVDPNDSAAILVASTACIVYFLAKADSKYNKMMYGTACLLAVFATLSTQSRGGLLGLVIVLFFLLNSRDKQSQKPKALKKYTIMALIIATVGIGASLFLNEAAKQRLSTITNLSSDYNTSEEGRFGLWARSIEALTTRPWGWGIAQYQIVDYKMGGDYKTAHNIFFQLSVETGIQNGILLILIFLRTYKHLGNMSQLSGSAYSREAKMANTIRCAVIGYFFCSLFLSFAYFALLYFLLGLTESMLRTTTDLQRKNETKEDKA